MAALPYIQIALAAITITLILLQERGGGMSGLLGGDGQGTYSARRGVEGIIFHATIVSVVAFAALTLVQLYFARY